MNRSIATNRVASGDPFFATVANPVVVSGQTVIPEGTPVKARVVSVHEAGRLKGVARLRLALESVEVDGSYYALHTSTFAHFGRNHKRRNWEIIGGGSGGGEKLDTTPSPKLPAMAIENGFEGHVVSFKSVN